MRLESTLIKMFCPGNSYIPNLSVPYKKPCIVNQIPDQSISYCQLQKLNHFKTKTAYKLAVSVEGYDIDVHVDQ